MMDNREYQRKMLKKMDTLNEHMKRIADAVTKNDKSST